MASVARGRRRASASPPVRVVPRLPALPPAGAARPLPEAVDQERHRALTAALDVLRLSLTALFRRVAQHLTVRPSECTLATLEGEVQDTLATLGATLLSELVRLRGTGDLGPAYTCPCGVRLERTKEVAPLVQRTWFGPITLVRTAYAGKGCRVRAHQVPLDAAWALLGATPDTAAAPQRRVRSSYYHSLERWRKQYRS